jgi:CubicO group peptidase (beta-lactamase class C family)
MSTIFLNKINLRTALSVALLLLSLLWFDGKGLFAQQPGLPVAQLDSLIANALKPAGSQGPGVAVYLHRQGSDAYQNITGMANLEYGIPLTEHSVFDLASVAKQFTGMAIAKLLKAEKINLDDDVRKYLPEVPDFGTTITLAHLLHHTSGLRDVGELYGVGNFGGEFTAETALRIVSRQLALNFTPGTEHDYSNTGYV